MRKGNQKYFLVWNCSRIQLTENDRNSWNYNFGPNSCYFHDNQSICHWYMYHTILYSVVHTTGSTRKKLCIYSLFSSDEFLWFLQVSESTWKVKILFLIKMVHVYVCISVGGVYTLFGCASQNWYNKALGAFCL